METLLKYVILPEEKVVLEYFVGNVDLDAFISYKKELSKDPDYDASYCSIADCNEAELQIEQQDVLDYCSFLETEPKLIGERRAILITTRPKHIALLMLFEYTKTKLEITPAISSCLDDAMRILSIPLRDWKAIDAAFMKLKSKTAV